MTSIVKTDNDNSFKNYFWYVPINNGEETIGLLEKTTRIVNNIYIYEPLKVASTYQVVLESYDTQMQNQF